MCNPSNCVRGGGAGCAGCAFAHPIFGPLVNNMYVDLAHTEFWPCFMNCAPNIGVLLPPLSIFVVLCAEGPHNPLFDLECSLDKESVL